MPVPQSRHDLQNNSLPEQIEWQRQRLVEDSAQSLTDLSLDHLSPVNLVCKVKGEVVVTDCFDCAVHVRLSLDLKMWL